MTELELIIAYIIKSLWWIIPCLAVLIVTAIVEARDGD